MAHPIVVFLGIGALALMYYYYTSREPERISYRSSNRPYKSKYDEEGCSICQEIVYNVSSLRTLSCGHRFHHYCINKWFEAVPQPRTCPNCRQAVI